MYLNICQCYFELETQSDLRIAFSHLYIHIFCHTAMPSVAFSTDFLFVGKDGIISEVDGSDVLSFNSFMVNMISRGIECVCVVVLKLQSSL